MGALVGWITYLVMILSCRTEVDGVVTTCRPLAVTLGAVGAIAGTIGMAIVLVLVFRSIAEYREATARGAEPPGPGCETDRGDDLRDD